MSSTQRDQQTDASGFGGGLHGSPNASFYEEIAQLYTPTANLYVMEIDINMKKFASPVDNLILDIVTSLDGTALATSTVDGSTLTSSNAFILFKFSTPCNLTSGTQYYFQLRRSGASDDTNFYGFSSGSSGTSFQKRISSVWASSGLGPLTYKIFSEDLLDSQSMYLKQGFQ